MLPFFDDYLQAKNLRYRLIPSRDIHDTRRLKFLDFSQNENFSEKSDSVSF